MSESEVVEFAAELDRFEEVVDEGGELLVGHVDERHDGGGHFELLGGSSSRAWACLVHEVGGVAPLAEREEAALFVLENLDHFLDAVERPETPGAGPPGFLFQIIALPLGRLLLAVARRPVAQQPRRPPPL